MDIHIPHFIDNQRVFSGLPKAKIAREHLKLDVFDAELGDSNDTLVIHFPDDTMAVTIYFVRGLFHKSVKNRGMNFVRERYQFADPKFERGRLEALRWWDVDKSPMDR